MARSTIGILLLSSLSAIVACSSEPGDQRRVWEDETGIVELVELSEADQAALKAAPATTMKRPLSSELDEAIRSHSIDGIKIQLVRDKIDGEVVDKFPPTYQGWIYYKPTKLSDGTPYAPAVLCVSQSIPIDWFYCDDTSELATKRLLKKQRHQT